MPDDNYAKLYEGIKTECPEEPPIKVGEKRLEIQDPLREVNLGSDENKRRTFISTKLPAQQQKELTRLLTKYKDCFT